MKLYTISCDPQCGFKVTSHDKEETMKMSAQHVMENHPEVKMNPGDAEARMEVTEV